jgi:hypothetical protein
MDRKELRSLNEIVRYRSLVMSEPATFAVPDLRSRERNPLLNSLVSESFFHNVVSFSLHLMVSPSSFLTFVFLRLVQDIEQLPFVVLQIFA